MLEYVNDIGPDKIKIAVFEGYGPIGKLSGKITERAEMCGILKYKLLQSYNIPVVSVVPTSLKKYTTGKGNATKEQMRQEAAKRGYNPETSDEVDAYFCALLGERILTGGKLGVDYSRVNP